MTGSATPWQLKLAHLPELPKLPKLMLWPLLQTTLPPQ